MGVPPSGSGYSPKGGAAKASPAKPSIPNAWPSFNVNQEVAVRLTEEGLRIMRRNHDSINGGGLFPGHRPGLLGDFRPPETDEDGWSRFQLWTLMREFGADFIMGNSVPFETTIRLAPKAVSEPPCRWCSGETWHTNFGPRGVEHEIPCAHCNPKGLPRSGGADGLCSRCAAPLYPKERCPVCAAQAIETRQRQDRETGLGPKDESAVAKPCAQGGEA